MAGVSFVPLGEGDDIEFDTDQYSQPQVQRSCWGATGRVVVFVLPSAAGVAAAHFLSGPWEALAALGGGVLAGIGVKHDVKGISRVELEKALLSTFGQTALFALTQVYVNINNSEAQKLCTSLINWGFGLHIPFLIDQIYQTHVTGSESSVGMQGPTLRSVLPDNYADVTRVLAAASLGAVSLLQGKGTFQDLTAFFGLYFAWEIPGTKALNWFDRRIQKHDADNGVFAPSRVRVVKNLFLAASMGVMSFGLSYNSPIIGCVGMGAGLLSQGLKNRIRHIPLKNLTELQRYEASEHLTYRVWEAAHPVFTAAGIFGFTIWQEIWELDNPTDRAALALMAVGYFLTYFGARAIDSRWDQEGREQNDTPSWKVRLMDFLVQFSLLDPTILINPAIFFAAITNVLKMGDEALDEEHNELNKALILAAWFCYGIAMGQEYFRTSGRRVGSNLQVISMFMINAMLNFLRVFRREIP